MAQFPHQWDGGLTLELIYAALDISDNVNEYVDWLPRYGSKTVVTAFFVGPLCTTAT